MVYRGAILDKPRGADAIDLASALPKPREWKDIKELSRGLSHVDFSKLLELVGEDPKILEQGPEELGRKLLYFSRNWSMGTDFFAEHPWVLKLSLDWDIIPRIEWITSTDTLRPSRNKPEREPPVYRNVSDEFVRYNMPRILAGDRIDFVKFMRGEFLTEQELKREKASDVHSAFGKFATSFANKLEEELRRETP